MRKVSHNDSVYSEMEILGLWVTRDVVKPIDKNKSNKNTKQPTTRK